MKKNTTPHIEGGKKEKIHTCILIPQKKQLMDPSCIVGFIDQSWKDAENPFALAISHIRIDCDHVHEIFPKNNH